MVITISAIIVKQKGVISSTTPHVAAFLIITKAMQSSIIGATIETHAAT